MDKSAKLFYEMYFVNRKEAAELLAVSLARYTDDDAIVATLTPDSDKLGAVIAGKLRVPMTTLISRVISLPGESADLGSVDQTGHFSYSTGLTEGQIDEYASEYHKYIESEKISKTQELNRESVKSGLIDRNEFEDKVVILVSDGVDETTELDTAIEYLKPINLKRLIIAVPVASVKAVDRMHIACDEIHCLSVTENYLSADHYYDDTRAR